MPSKLTRPQHSCDANQGNQPPALAAWLWIKPKVRATNKGGCCISIDCHRYPNTECRKHLCVLASTRQAAEVTAMTLN